MRLDDRLLQQTWNELRMFEMFTELSLGVAHVTRGADNVSISITEVTITDSK